MIDLLGVSWFPIRSLSQLRRAENNAKHRPENAPHGFPMVTRVKAFWTKKSPATQRVSGDHFSSERARGLEPATSSLETVPKCYRLIFAGRVGGAISAAVRWPMERTVGKAEMLPAAVLATAN
jgi:hypothetical protein